MLSIFVSFDIWHISRCYFQSKKLKHYLSDKVLNLRPWLESKGSREKNLSNYHKIVDKTWQFHCNPVIIRKVWRATKNLGCFSSISLYFSFLFRFFIFWLLKSYAFHFNCSSETCSSWTNYKTSRIKFLQLLEMGVKSVGQVFGRCLLLANCWQLTVDRQSINVNCQPICWQCE